MEGTNPPLLKGASRSGILSGPPHYSGQPKSSWGGRVENGDREKEGLGRMEGVPAWRLVWIACLGWPAPSFQVGPRPCSLGKRPGRPSVAAPSSRGPATFAQSWGLGPRRQQGRGGSAPSLLRLGPGWGSGSGSKPGAHLCRRAPSHRAHKDDTRGPGRVRPRSSG